MNVTCPNCGHDRAAHHGSGCDAATLSIDGVKMCLCTMTPDQVSDHHIQVLAETLFAAQMALHNIARKVNARGHDRPSWKQCHHETCALVQQRLAEISRRKVE